MLISLINEQLLSRAKGLLHRDDVIKLIVTSYEKLCKQYQINTQINETKEETEERPKKRLKGNLKENDQANLF